MKLRKRYIGVGALIGLGVLLSQFPASWAAGLSGAQLPVTPGGTVWKGYIPAIAALPPVSFKTSPMGVFSDAPLATFDGSGNGLSIQGAAEANRITSLKLKGDAIYLGQIDGRFGNLLGQFTLAANELQFDGNCEAVSGQVSTDILTQNRASWQWAGPSLSGPITCEDGVLTTTLSGNIPGQSVEAVLKVSPDGNWQLRAVINTNTPEAGLVLPLYGFEGQGERFTMNEAGRWK
jgi:hypothetical protein